MQSALAMLLLDARLIALMIATITRTAAERFLPCATLKRTSPSRPLHGLVP
jgi:hypothetical protein